MREVEHLARTLVSSLGRACTPSFFSDIAKSEAMHVNTKVQLLIDRLIVHMPDAR